MHRNDAFALEEMKTLHGHHVWKIYGKKVDMKIEEGDKIHGLRFSLPGIPLAVSAYMMVKLLSLETRYSPGRFW